MFGVPKCLAPVGNRTFLEVQLEELSRRGVQHFVLSIGYLGEQVVDAVKKFGRRFEISIVQEEKPLGTGGALLNSLATLGLHEVLVANGDTLVRADLDELHRPLNTKECEKLRMAVINVADRARFGGVVIDNERIIGFLEKGVLGEGLINAGLYRLSIRAFEGRSVGDSFSFESEIIPRLVTRCEARVSLLEGSFIDIGVPHDYARLCRQLSPS